MRAPISSLKIVPVLLALNPYHLGETLFLTVAPTLGSSEPLRGKNARCSTLGTRAVSRSGTMWYRLLLDSMFDLPSLEGVKEVVISQQVVEGTKGPLYMYGGGMRAS